MSASQQKPGAMGRPHSALRKVITRYFAGLLLLALLCAASFGVFRVALALQAQDTKISRLVFAQSQAFDHIEALSGELIRLARTTGTADHRLDTLRQEIKLNAESISANMEEMFEIERERPSFLRRTHPIARVYGGPPYDLEKRLTDYLNHVDRLTSKNNAELVEEVRQWTPAEIALVFGTRMKNSFRAALDEAHEATLDDLAKLNHFVEITTLVTMMVLLSEALFLFVPLIRQLREESDQIRAYETELRRQASEDQLTSLANRSTFYEQLRDTINQAGDKRPLSLILFDLDRFKPINDTLGHQTGDRLLERTARRARQVLDDDDLIARLGGDEFAILTRRNGSREQLETLIGQLTEAIEEPVSHGNWEIRPSASFGCANYPEHARSSEELFAAADAALYLAKREKTSFHIYDCAMRAADEERRQIARDLRQAMPAGQLAVFYQPQFDIGDMTPKGFEALVRWWHPTRGLIGAADFVPVAERLGLIPDLSTAVVDIVTRDIRQWLDSGRDPGVISINLPEEMFAMGIAEPLLAQALEREGVAYDRICVEVTEDVFLNRASEKIIEILASIRKRGMSVAFDDFGTGYASLSHLKNFPFDTIKIDRSFVSDIGRDDPGSEIVRALVGLARNLNKEVVAEGVETIEQCRFLHAEGCQAGQGYLYAKPMPFNEATAFTRPLAEPLASAASVGEAGTAPQWRYAAGGG